MKKNTSIYIIICLTIVISLFFFVRSLSLANSDADYQVYLPNVFNQVASKSLFGVEFTGGRIEGINEIIPTNTTWVRKNGLFWSDVSPNNRSERNWTDQSVLRFENQIKILTYSDLEPIVIIRSTPTWAQKVPGSACGPIKSENFQDFADFVYDAVLRYSVPPYQVKNWEIWNEPDIDPSIVPSDSMFGCWGDENDPYYGGRYYADMLKVVYPAIKMADPEAQVLVGGLLLDCDPRLNSNCISSKFLEGILRNGGGAYFDGVSFHAYDFYPVLSNRIGAYLNVGWKTAWNTTGTVSFAKASYLHDLLNDPQFGVSGKYLSNTEAALICDQCDDNYNYELTKAYLVPQIYSSAYVLNLRANIWFSVTGWRNSGLLWENLQPRPAFNAYVFARQELDSVSYVPPQLTFNVDADPDNDVVGFKFVRGQTTIWVIWSLDGDPHIVSLPSNPSAIYDTFGAPQSITGNSVNVTIKPLYLEWKQ